MDLEDALKSLLVSLLNPHSRIQLSIGCSKKNKVLIDGYRIGLATRTAHEREHLGRGQSVLVRVFVRFGSEGRRTRSEPGEFLIHLNIRILG